MKRIAITILTIFTLISLGACAKNQQDSTKGSEETAMSSKESKATDEAFDKNKKMKSVFTAVLIEDAKKNETKDQSIRLVLKEVDAVEDPKEIVGMMKNDGVILNVPSEKIADSVTEKDLKAGDKIQFTLVGLPAMTMSIPPQVAGNSVINVQKI